MPSELQVSAGATHGFVSITASSRAGDNHDPAPGLSFRSHIAIGVRELSRACGGEDECACYRTGGDRKSVGWAVGRDARVEADEGRGAERQADEVRSQKARSPIPSPVESAKLPG